MIKCHPWLQSEMADLIRIYPYSCLDCHSCSRSILTKILGEDSLPNIEPFLLLSSRQLAWLFEWPRQKFTKTRPEDLDNQHSLPIWNRKASSISIENNYSGIHLQFLGQHFVHHDTKNNLTSHRTSPHKRAMANASTAVASWAWYTLNYMLVDWKDTMPVKNSRSGLHDMIVRQPSKIKTTSIDGRWMEADWLVCTNIS